MSNPVYNQSRESSKILTVVKELRRLKDLCKDSGTMDKAVIVSQWTSMLDIVKKHVDKMGMKSVEINGKTLCTTLTLKAGYTSNLPAPPLKIS